MSTKLQRRQADPGFMVATARDTARAARALLELNEKYRMQAQVLAVLAIEHMLKAAAQIEHGGYLQEHDLVKLYKDLPEALQQQVLDEYEEPKAPSDAGGQGVPFVERLTRIKSDFVDSRYFYEMVESTEEVVMFEEATGLAAVIWKGLHPTLTSVPLKESYGLGPEPSGREFTRKIRIEH